LVQDSKGKVYKIASFDVEGVKWWRDLFGGFEVDDSWSNIAPLAHIPASPFTGRQLSGDPHPWAITVSAGRGALPGGVGGAVAPAWHWETEFIEI